MIPRSSSTSLDIAGSNEVSDIANSMCDDPVPPRQHCFPATLFGNKTTVYRVIFAALNFRKFHNFCFFAKLFSSKIFINSAVWVWLTLCTP